MARNRKRAKERRARRPQPVASVHTEPTPGPIAHAAPDVELAEAQLALGRPELSDDAQSELADDEGFDDNGGLPPGPGSTLVAGGDGELGGGGIAVAEPRGHIGNRLIGFLQGSWRELQRVQWPDRRQVVQATGVVIGFVIVAGVFLGVADTVASKLMTFILK